MVGGTASTRLLGGYGAGSVVVWDSGSYELIEFGDPAKQLETGKSAFALYGKKLKGAFVLTRLARGEIGKEWFLIKQKDEYADPSWKPQTQLTPERLKKLAARIPPCETS
jgi:hypothetical protein